MSSKSVLQECQVRSVLQVSHKSVKQELLNSVKQGCHLSVWTQDVSQVSLLEMWQISIVSVCQHTCLHSGSWASSCLRLICAVEFQHVVPCWNYDQHSGIASIAQTFLATKTNSKQMGLGGYCKPRLLVQVPWWTEVNSRVLSQKFVVAFSRNTFQGVNTPGGAETLRPEAWNRWVRWEKYQRERVAWCFFNKKCTNHFMVNVGLRVFLSKK